MTRILIKKTKTYNLQKSLVDIRRHSERTLNLGFICAVDLRNSFKIKTGLFYSFPCTNGNIKARKQNNFLNRKAN